MAYLDVTFTPIPLAVWGQKESNLHGPFEHRVYSPPDNHSRLYPQELAPAEGTKKPPGRWLRWFKGAMFLCRMGYHPPEPV